MPLYDSKVLLYFRAIKNMNQLLRTNYHDNPWKRLPATCEDFVKDQSYILLCDKTAIKSVNSTYIQNYLPPEPFAGRIDASVVVLMKMPQYTPFLDDELFRHEKFAKI